MRCNFNLHRFFSSVFLCLLIAMPKAKSEDNLASQDDWLALVHYQPKWSGGFESTLDTPNFF